MNSSVSFQKTEFITFELFCRLILYNFYSVNFLHAPINDKKRKYIYQVNVSLATKICFDFPNNKVLSNIKSLISKYILPIRPERNYARQHRVQKSRLLIPIRITRSYCRLKYTLIFRQTKVCLKIVPDNFKIFLYYHTLLNFTMCIYFLYENLFLSVRLSK